MSTTELPGNPGYSCSGPGRPRGSFSPMRAYANVRLPDPGGSRKEYSIVDLTSKRAAYVYD